MQGGLRCPLLATANGTDLVGFAGADRSAQGTLKRLKTLINVLLQTTIEASSDDWSVDRFSYLRDFLSEVLDDEGNPSFRVTARNREKLGAPDSVLSNLRRSDSRDHMDLGSSVCGLERVGTAHDHRRDGLVGVSPA
jgi:hypothetical protein